MKKLILILLMLCMLPMMYAISCAPGCASCHYLASNCPTCERTDEIWNWSINPCINHGEINFSSPIEITITPHSYYTSESGLGLDYAYCQNTSVRAILYYGDSNQQDSGWSTWNYQGNVIKLDETYWDLNKSGDYSLKLFARFNVSGSTWETVLINFTLAPNTSIGNVYFGDCKTNSYASSPSTPDDALNISFGGFPTWSKSLLWSLFMFVVAFIIWFTMGESREGNNIRTATTVLIVLLLGIIGAATRLIDWTYLAVFFVGVAVYFGIKLRSILTGG